MQDRVELAGVAPTVWVCGDDAGDRERVAGLVRDLGLEPSIAGALEMSRLVEPAMVLTVLQAYGGSSRRLLALRLLEGA